jgi:hypothetical protein
MERTIVLIRKRGNMESGWRWIARFLLAAAALCASVLPTGCRKPRAPEPLAPGLRGPVKDLAAVRGGEQLWLTWTMPRKSVGKLAVNGHIPVQVCRRESPAGACTDVGEPLLLAPGTAGSFSESLPAGLASGTPRVLYYFVELKDRNGRSTGLSNSVATLAGTPLPAIQGLTAKMTENGVLLRWAPVSAAEEPEWTAIRLHCTEVILKSSAAGSRQSSTAPTTEPAEHDLWVQNGGQSGQALDTDIRYGDTYVYSAQRVVRVAIGNQTLELAGQLSAPVQIDAVKVALPDALRR